MFCHQAAPGHEQPAAFSSLRTLPCWPLTPPLPRNVLQIKPSGGDPVWRRLRVDNSGMLTLRSRKLSWWLFTLDLTAHANPLTRSFDFSYRCVLLCYRCVLLWWACCWSQGGCYGCGGGVGSIAGWLSLWKFELPASCFPPGLPNRLPTALLATGWLPSGTSLGGSTATSGGLSWVLRQRHGHTGPSPTASPPLKGMQGEGPVACWRRAGEAEQGLPVAAASAVANMCNTDGVHGASKPPAAAPC